MLKIALKWSLGLAAGVALLSSAGGALAVDIKLATDFPEGHPVYDATFQFAKEVTERTNGDVNVRVFPAGQLGDYTSVFEEVKNGTIEMAMSGINTSFEPRLDFINLPYLTSSWDEAHKLNSPGGFVYDKTKALLQPVGIELLGTMALGFTGIGLKELPDNITDPAASKGALVRVPPMDSFKILAGDLGFNSVSIPWSDLYTSLQTRVAEGMMGSQAQMTYLAFQDVMNVYVAANVSFETLPIMINESTFNSLTDEQKQIMLEVADEIAAASYGPAEASEEEYRQKLEDAGWTVVRLTDDQLEQWAEYVRGTTWSKLEDRITPELMTELSTAIN